MSLLATALMVDYLLTYAGIHAGVITEANPLMIWLFDLPLWAGLLCRVGIIAVLCGALWLARNRRYYKWLMRYLTMGYSMVFILHGIWIAQMI